MTTNNEIWLLIIGMFIVGFLPRYLPIILLKGRELPLKFVQWMNYVPVAIFTALVFSDIFFWESEFSLDLLTNVKLIASLIVAFVSIKFKNLFLSMITGVVAISLLLLIG